MLMGVANRLLPCVLSKYFCINHADQSFFVFFFVFIDLFITGFTEYETKYVFGNKRSCEHKINTNLHEKT